MRLIQDFVAAKDPAHVFACSVAEDFGLHLGYPAELYPARRYLEYYYDSVSVNFQVGMPLGLDSIREMMEQMNGICQAHQGENVFELTLLFPCSSDNTVRHA